MSQSAITDGEALAALAWLIEAGADEAVEATALDRTQRSEPATQSAARTAPETAAAQTAAVQPAAPASSPPRQPEEPQWRPEAKPPTAVSAAIAEARHLAAAARSLPELEQAIRSFEGCPLKQVATNTVIARGNPAARILLIGEAPGREEDQRGQPFVGAAGKLLDRMLAAIGLDESQVYISNSVFWRPPGNTTPSDQHVAICLPFVERLIALVAPDFLILLGNVAVKSVLAESRGITRIHGKWLEYRLADGDRPIAAMPLYHPAYLLRQPLQKRAAWRDLLALRRALDEAGIMPR